MFHLALVTDSSYLSDWVPEITKNEIEKTRIPQNLLNLLLTAYDGEMKETACKDAFVNCLEITDSEDKCLVKTIPRTLRMNLSSTVGQTVREQMRSLAEQWAGIKLEHQKQYVVRYLNGTKIYPHFDMFNNFVISGIVNIGQKVEQDWPLYMLDRNGDTHRVILHPGEMVWSESARVIHGRPEQLRGEYYDNFIISFRPADAWYTEEYFFGLPPRYKPYTLNEIREIQLGTDT